jgi:hypothetical protein
VTADAALVIRALHARADDLERRAADPRNSPDAPAMLLFLAEEFRDLAADISYRLSPGSRLPGHVFTG